MRASMTSVWRHLWADYFTRMRSDPEATCDPIHTPALRH